MALAQTELPWAFTEVRFEPSPAAAAPPVPQPAAQPAPDLIRAALGDELADMIAAKSPPSAATVASAATNQGSEVAAESSVAPPPPAPPAEELTPPSAGGEPAGKRQQRCAICKAIGHNARTCNVSTSPAKDSAAEPPGTPPSPPRVARQPSPAPSPFVPQAPVTGRPMRDLPRTQAAIERRERQRLRATPEALIARGVKANPEAQAAVVDARPVISIDLDDPHTIVPALPVPIASFVF